MLGPAQHEQLARLLPRLQADQQLWGEMTQHGLEASLPPGQHVCREGAVCAHLALVLSGSVRVYKLGESGREITLYRIATGEACILTASCILSDRLFPAFAVTADAVEAALFPAPLVRSWMIEHTAWRRYVWALLAERLADVISLIEEVAFRRLDERLAQYLLAAPGPGDLLRTTHQEVAKDLGTSREVVSRILKDFEERGVLTLGRGVIQLRDRAGLRRHTRQSV